MSTRFRRLFCRLFALLLACAALAPASPALADPPRSAGTAKKLIALTFDDGPSDNTPTLLDGLEQRGAVATFFMCGANGSHGVVKHADLLPRMIALGCQLANHTYSHYSFARLTDDQMASEVTKVEQYLYAAQGDSYLEVVRIPGGANTERIRANVHHPIITWSVDPFDWRDRDEDVVYERILERAHDGGIILLHDLYPTSIAAGLRAIDTLRSQGYEFVTVSELFRRRGIYLENGVVYSSARTEITYAAYTPPRLETWADGSGGVRVALSSSEPGVSSIHYTTDGSVPTLSSPLYTGPFSVSEDTLVRSAGFDRFATRTPLNEKTVRTCTAIPKITDISRGKVSLASATPGAKILYTTDGSDPRLNGAEYTKPFPPGKVTKAVAIVRGQARSDIATLVKTTDGSLFCDLDPSAWYVDAVGDAVKRGLMGSIGDYRFAPANGVTRAALASVLYRMDSSPEPPASSYQDVPADAWYASAVAWAGANNLFPARDSGVFAPNETLSRLDAAITLYNYARYTGRTGKSGDLSAYADAGEVASWATEAVAWCAANGLMERGDGRLAVLEPLLRAQCAAAVSALSGIRS